jgi:hypothetical protein
MVIFMPYLLTDFVWLASHEAAAFGKRMGSKRVEVNALHQI